MASAAAAGSAGLASWETRFRAVALWVQVQARAALSEGVRTGEALLDGALLSFLRREVTAQVVLAYADGGRLAEAQALVDGAVALGAESVTAEAAGADLLAWCNAELDVLGGDRRRAGRKAAAVLAGARQWPVPDLAAVTLAWAGVVAEPGSSTLPGRSPVSGSALEVEALSALATFEPQLDHAAELFADAAQRWEGLSRRSVLRCRLASALATADADPLAALTRLRSLAQELEGDELVMLARQVTRARRQFGDTELPALSTGPRGNKLSRREAEVMAGVAEGFTTVVIAGRLGVAPSTVESQVKSAMRKLGATTRTEAAVLAVQ